MTDDEDFDPDKPYFDLSICDCDSEVGCEKLFVSFYGQNTMDIRVNQPVTPWKTQNHTLLRLGRQDIEWLFREIGRNLHGWGYRQDSSWVDSL